MFPKTMQGSFQLLLEPSDNWPGLLTIEYDLSVQLEFLIKIPSFVQPSELQIILKTQSI